MPATADLSSVLDRQLLEQLGGRLKALRLSRRLSQTSLAQSVGISRTTLTAVEAGDPSPTMGTYLRIMSALGISGDLALLASEVLKQPSGDEPVATGSARRVVASASNARHEVQDLQSLMLHREAVRLMSTDLALLQQALQTLDKWRAKGPSRSQVLWDEWAVILRRKEWRKALAPTRRGKELRQASPLPTVLPVAVRQSVLDQVQQLKKGVVLGELPATRTRAKR